MSRFHIRKRLKKILLNGKAQAVRHNVRQALRQASHGAWIRNLSYRPRWWQEIRAVRKVYTSHGQLM